MTTSSPTQVLRRAADKIRTLATADGVPPGPWTITPRHRKGTKIVAQYDLHKPPLPGSSTPGFQAISPTRTDALYSAAMHPGVGLALADWLIDSATTHLPNTECGYCTPARNPLRLPCPALAVARAVLGEQQ